MKRVCFIEFEGVFDSVKDYSVDKENATKFAKKLSAYCNKNKIELFLISGLHEKVALKKYKTSFIKDIIKKENFFFVDEKYISNKSELDEKLHRENLEKDIGFEDSFFKQIIISKIVEEKKLAPYDILLLCNDVWVDGYYTMKFSKVDFALFENNLKDRSNPVERINGLAYFNFDFKTVKTLLDDFPVIDYSSLDKFVFETMKKVLLKETDFSGLINKVSKRENNVN